MTTAMRTAEEIAKRTWTGSYGSAGETRLVKRGDKHYLLHDQFCGMDSPEGGMLRAFVYAVPAARVKEIAELLDMSIDSLGDNWEHAKMFVLPELECYGRQQRLSWAKNL